MKTQGMFAVLVLAVVVGGSMAYSQRTEFATGGVTEIGGSISFSSISEVYAGKTGDATTILSVGPKIGYFVANGFELGIHPGISAWIMPPGLSVVSGGGSTSTLLQLFAFAAYNIRNEGSTMHPFIEVPFGYTSQSSGSYTSSGFSWGIRGGIKVAPLGALLVTISGEYYQITMSPTGAKERTGFNFFSFGVGVGGFF
jgi:hypothetical protein